jgi:hypothetical protein
MCIDEVFFSGDSDKKRLISNLMLVLMFWKNRNLIEIKVTGLIQTRQP